MPTVVVPLLDATPSFSAPSAGVPTVAFGDEAAPIYELIVVDRAGNPQSAALDLAEPDTYVETLNEPDEATFHFPKNAYTSDDLDVLGTNGSACEIQLYRNGDLLTWGPITGISGASTDGATSCKVNGVDWYLNRLFLDGTIDNILDNGDFEIGAGTDDWDSNVTWSADTETFVTGTRAIKLVNSVAGTDAFISQGHVVSAGRLGLALIASAWVYKDAEIEPALETRGLYIDGIQAGVLKGYNYAPVDNASPVDAQGKGAVGNWVKVTTNIWIPPFQTWTINVRLYAPKGTVRWDDVKLVAMYSVDAAGHDGTTLVATDISHIIATMVTHVQNDLVGKADLHIGYNVEPTGTTLIKVWQYVDHVQFDQALHELLDRGDGADYHLAITPTTRVFYSHAFKRGADRSGVVTLLYDSADTSGPGGSNGSNCTGYRMTKDGGLCVTRQTFLGEDNGPAREQGEAFDATYTGGAILQDVRQAPHDTHTSSLQPLADDRIRLLSTVPFTLDLDVIGSSGLIPVIHCGDIVSVNVNDGWSTVFGTYRIMKRSLNCVTNILTVTVSRDTL